MEERVRRERRCWSEQECVIVACRHEGADGDEPIAAGAVLDNDGLAPAC